MDFLPHVVSATHERGFRIRLRFNDGLEATVDFEPWLAGEIFEPLKKPSYFRRFFLDGGTVVWPNGADVAPETLYEAAQRSDINSAVPDARRRARAPQPERVRR